MASAGESLPVVQLAAVLARDARSPVFGGQEEGGQALWPDPSVTRCSAITTLLVLYFSVGARITHENYRS